MAQSVTELFGATATLSNGEVTIKASDFPAINSPSTASASVIMAALLKRLKTLTDADADATKAIAASTFQNPFSFVVRGTSNQIQEAIIINIYHTDPIGSTLDPDTVIV
jgi:hypothetical protein